ncbi:MAG: helicase-related protein [Candidatus Thermoplasmatota archaeon]|nr:helicase-related protein [Candidatus Thermoplasmatota archaeon]
MFEPRLYQRNIAETCKKHSTLVVLPTGLGKTLIAMLAIKEKPGRVLFLAPTKPLVEQHFKTLSSYFDLESKSDPDPHPHRRVKMLTGIIPKEKRVAVYKEADIIVATPQVIENDMDVIDFKEVSMIVFDEAHRAVGNYSYVAIAQRYLEENTDPHMIGMTASPGSDADRILEICRNLGIEKIEIRSEDDEDVKPYVSRIAYEWIMVELPEDMKEIRALLQGVYDEAINDLKGMGYLRGFRKVPKRELISLGKELRSGGGSRFAASTYYAIALKIDHAIELIETQDIDAFLQYFERLKDDNTRARRMIMQDRRVLRAIHLAKNCTAGHEKIEKIVEIVKKQLEEKKDSKIIVFAQYRDVVEKITEKLAGIKVSKFIGQANRVGEKGLKQKEQIEIMDKFRRGEYNVIVATSVGEEGLDVPSTDMVIFYEPSPSEIRTIQRRGRTGRNAPGRVIFLITRGTRDEAFYWASKRKERAMHLELKRLREKIRAKLESPEVKEKIKSSNKRKREKGLKQQTIDLWSF